MTESTIDSTRIIEIPSPTAHQSGQAPTAYEAVRFNAVKHGILSRYTVLSHENHADYESLVDSLMAEHLT